MLFAAAPMPRDQISLIPVTLGELIADDHPLRLLDELLDQLDWSPFDQHYRIEDRGRPPIAPRILAACWVYAHFRKVRSSRLLEYQLNTNVEFMWLAHGHRIDHSTLANFRRANQVAIKDINRQLISLAKDLGVIKLAEIYVDGTKIKANSNRFRTLTASKANKLLEHIEGQIESFLREAELEDTADDLFEGEVNGEKLPEQLANLRLRQQQLQSIRDTCQTADAERKKHGINPEKNPFQLPVTDQDSRILPNKEGGYAPNYTPVVGVESELGLIVSTTLINSVNEQDYLVGIIDDVQDAYAVTVDTVCADAGFSIGTNIVELEVNRGKNFLSPHRNGDVSANNPAIRADPTLPVAPSQWSQLPRDPSTKKFSQEAFVYDAEADQYYCPQGKPMKRGSVEVRVQSTGMPVKTTRYQTESCDGCAALALCRKGAEAKTPRSVRRDEHATVREQHRAKMSTAAAKAGYGKRFSAGERIFGQIKEGFGLRRFQSRGLPSVTSEFGFAQLAHNVLRLTNVKEMMEALRRVKSIASQQEVKNK